MGSYRTPAEADRQLEIVRGKGIASAFIVKGVEWNRLEIGPFKYSVEAQLIKDDLRAGDYPEAFIADLKQATPAVPEPEANTFVQLAKPYFQVECDEPVNDYEMLEDKNKSLEDSDVPDGMSDPNLPPIPDEGGWHPC